MRFLDPAGLLLLAAVPLAAFLLLRGVRRRERPVAAFFLLRDLVDALPVLPPSYLRRRRLQAALFIAALACAALGAGGGVIGRVDDPPQRAVVLIDHLALWQDAQGTSAQWREVTAAAAAAARSFRDDDLILVARSDTGIAGGGFLAPRRAAALIEKLRPSALPADPAATLDLLALLERTHAPSLIGVVTPSPVRWRALLGTRGPAWRVIAVPPGASAPNHALLDVEVRPDLLRAGRVAIACRVGSFGSPGQPAAQLGLEITRDGQPLARRNFRIAPGETHLEIFPALDAGAGLLQVELSPTDGFPADNRFLMPLRERVAVPSLLVTEGNPPLEAALRALPGLELTVARATARETPPRATVRVYDALAPRELSGNLFVIAPPEGLPGVGYRGDASSPRLIRADAGHFLLQGVSFENLRIGRLPIYEIPGGLDVLATADGYPLLAAGRLAGGARLVLLAFDPRESEWVYDPSFPILVANIAAWLAESGEGTRSSFLVGETLPEDLASSTQALVDPSGRRESRPPDGWRSFAFPVPGRWGVEGRLPGSGGEIFVNLLDEKVSATVAPAAASTAPATPLPRRPFRLETRRALLAAALVLLLLERLAAPPRRAGRLS